MLIIESGRDFKRPDLPADDSEGIDAVVEGDTALVAPRTHTGAGMDNNENLMTKDGRRFSLMAELI